jgi:hypothetical protein
MNERRRRLGLLSVSVAAVVIGCLSSASPAEATFDPHIINFDWAAGDDAAIGIPGEGTSAGTHAGAVEVRYDNDSTARALTLPHGHAGDRFGAALAAGRFDGDEYADLAVGVPGLDVAGRSGVGGVALFFGSPTGLHFSRLITQATLGVPGSLQAGAHFGAALATTAGAPGRKTLLRIGEPDRNVGSAVDAGGFVDLVLGSGSASGYRTREVTLATAGIPGSPRSGDRLGAALYQDMLVGAPGRTVQGAVGAGAVLYTRTDPVRLVTEASAGVPGTPEAGDHFGAALAFGLIGVPGESIGSIPEAGMVVHSATDPAERFAIVQGRNGVPGTATAGNHFGAALADLGIYVDDTEWRPRQIFVGAPGDDAPGPTDAGTVTALGMRYDPDGGVPFELTGVDRLLTAATPGAGAGLGTTLARDHDLILAGAPGGRGSVTLFRTDPSGTLTNPPSRVATWTQRAGKPEAGDRFGGALASTSD